jgi:hypothetical protein
MKIKFNNSFAFCGGIILSLIFIFFPRSNVSKDFEDPKLFGMNTTSVFGEYRGYRFHCSDAHDINNCLDGYRSFKASEIEILWLGNSQLHAVNNWRAGQFNAIEHAFNSLIKQNKYLIGISQPNANLQEHLIVFGYMSSVIKIKKLVIPLVFDDTRENEIRQSIFELSERQGVVELLSDTEVGKKIIDNRKKKDEEVSVDKDFARNFESYLNLKLEAISLAWSSRAIDRSNIFADLYLFRNSIFNIKPETKRKIIRSSYIDNKIALTQLIDLALNQGTEVYLYVAPIRKDLSIPYIDSEYNNYKNEMLQIAKIKNIRFIDYENLVGSEYWGVKKSTQINSGVKYEVDYMHFEEFGHKKLSNAVLNYIK